MKRQHISRFEAEDPIKRLVTEDFLQKRLSFGIIRPLTIGKVISAELSGDDSLTQPPTSLTNVMLLDHPHYCIFDDEC